MATTNKSGPVAVAGSNDLNGVVDNEAIAKNRVPVHVFNPEDSPQAKGAAAGKAQDKVKSIIPNQGSSNSKELPVDLGRSNVIPTINVKDVDKQEGENEKPLYQLPPQPVLPGEMPSALSPQIPDWYKAGWRAVSGIDAPAAAEGEEKDKGILDMFLAEQYYGSWYHNAALIFFAVFASHFLTRFHFGWGWLFILLAVCNTYYSTSMARVRRRARDDIQRELVKVRLASEHETADWINNFLDRFWLIYEPVLSRTVIASVDQILSTNTPPFLDSLRLTTFTLGTKAPRIDKVRTFPKTPDDIVMMDWGVSFTPNDISDMTPKQMTDTANPKIVLSVRFGRGVATAAMPILLEDITFEGLLRIRLKLTNNFPHIQLVDICFLEKPSIDFVLKPLGGDTFGLDINNIPGLSDFIHGMTHATLKPMMYDPNVFTLNLEQLLSGSPLDTAIGVLQVTVQSARSLKGTKLGGGSPDPYVSLSINERAELARTKYKPDTFNPTWAETKFLLINSITDSLVLTVYDYNEIRKDSLLGSASFALEQLRIDAKHEGVESHILKDGKERGQLRYDVSYFPVLKPQIANGKEEPLPETTVGIVRLTLHQAKDLDASKSLTGELNPFARLFVGNNPCAIHTTPLFKHTNTPIWESSTEFLCSDKASSVISIKVIDDRDFLKDPLVGYITVQLADLLHSQKEAGRDWWQLSGCKSGRLRMSAEWKPLNMAGSLEGANQYTPPIGVVRLFLEKAVDVKNVEAALGGKSDPYVRVQVNNVTKGRTEVVNNDLNPRWEQYVYIPVRSLKETMILECMDYQNLTKDRSLGIVELHVSDLAQPSDDKEYPYESVGMRSLEDPIRLDSGNASKGTLHYVAEFLPALALNNVRFKSRRNELQEAADGSDDELVSRESTPSIPQAITARQPLGAESEVASVMTNNSDAASAHTANANVEDAEPVDQLAEMNREELLSRQSGVIVFNVLSGQLAKKGRIEVLLDDGYWPAFATAKSQSTNARWDHVGEGFIKELDMGQVWLRLDESSNDEKDDIVGEWKGPAKQFLLDTLDGPHKFTLVHNDQATSTIEIEARYVPVPVKLDPRESVNNQGQLRVDLLNGRDITAVDRGGKSDPFAVFSLNGHKIFKSQIKKKTLDPEWNENFTVPVPSRVGADFSIEIFDWNQFEQAKSLGSSKIVLADLEPLQGTERILQLTSPKHGEKGQIQIRLLFEPEIIAKARKPTSTFTATMTTIGGMPMGAGKGVIQGVTGVLKKEIHLPGKNKEGDIVSQDFAGHVDQTVQPALPSAGLPPIPTATPDVQADHNSGNGTNEPGTLRVTILEAKALTTSDAKPYVVVRVGSMEHKTKHAAKSTSTPEWRETFTFRAGTVTPKLFAWVFDHKTLAKDKLLGEGEIEIWRYLRPDTTSSAEATIELRDGQGQLYIHLDFEASGNPLGNESSVNRTQSGTAPRFSIRGRRPGASEHED